MHGKGEFYFANGSKYIGEFKFDYFSGKGKRFYSDGYIYEGNFDSDKPNGKGIMYNPEGKIVFDGMWKDGNPVKQ